MTRNGTKLFGVASCDFVDRLAEFPPGARKYSDIGRPQWDATTELGPDGRNAAFTPAKVWQAVLASNFAIDFLSFRA